MVASLAKCEKDENRVSSIERLPRGAREREREKERGAKTTRTERGRSDVAAKKEAHGVKRAAVGRRVREARTKGKNVESRETERSRVEAAGFLSRHRRRHPTKIDPVRVPRPPRTGRVCVCTGYPACHRSVLLARDMLGLQWRQRVFRPRSLSPLLFFFYFFRSPYLAFIASRCCSFTARTRRPDPERRATSLMGAGER